VAAGLCEAASELKLL